MVCSVYGIEYMVYSIEYMVCKHKDPNMLCSIYTYIYIYGIEYMVYNIDYMVGKHQDANEVHSVIIRYREHGI